MASVPQDDVLMLGAGGKLGRMMRAAWPKISGRRLVPVARGAADGVLHWRPGLPSDGLPRVGAVVTLWGVTGSDPEALAMNTWLAEEAQSLAAQLGATRIVHCSSAAVYAPAETPIPEATPPAPVNFYGRAKHDMERRIFELAERGVTSTVLRIGNVAGAESLFGNMRPGGRITLHRFHSGRGPVRSYIGPTDLARAIACLLEAPPALAEGIFNVAAPAPVAMADLAKAAGCHVDWQPAPAGALERLTLDTTRLSSLCTMPLTSADPDWLVEDARTGGIWP